MNQIKNGDKLVVVTREDLSPGQQCVQSVHAAVDFCIRNPELAKDWNTISNYIVCVSVKDELALIRLINKCESKGLLYEVFREPDIGNAITSICIEPSDITQRVISNLPLTLKDNFITV